VRKVLYLGLLTDSHPDFEVYLRQYGSPGAMISFEVIGGEKEAFQFLNKLKLIKLAVSLGSTESLAEHPATMTHIGVDPYERQQIGITDSLIRLSIGVEHYEDLIKDISGALEAVAVPKEEMTMV